MSNVIQLLEYVTNRYVQFASEGNKEDPENAAKEMRVARDQSGKLWFAPEEWRTAKQIASYFSRLAATQCQQKAPGELLVEQDEAISEEDLQTWETERQLQELQTAVYEEVDLKHPIRYNGHDICGLAKRDMLKLKFKVAHLKKIANL